MEVDRWPVLEEREVGLPVRRDGAHVDPGAHERIGEDAVLEDHPGDEIGTDLVRRGGVAGVLLEALEEKAGTEDVDAHRGEGARRIFRLLDEGGDAMGAVDRGDPEAMGVLRPDLGDGDGHVRPGLAVEAQHLPVVLLVDVIAAHDEDKLGTAGGDQRPVLVEGVGRAAVPAVLPAVPRWGCQI